MDQSGEYRIPAERADVWRALNDPDTLKRCIDGCQSMERRPDGGFAAVVKARVGPVRAVFNAALDLTDINPPESYTINVAVKGGAAGFARTSWRPWPRRAPSSVSARTGAARSGRSTVSQLPRGRRCR